MYFLMKQTDDSLVEYGMVGRLVAEVGRVYCCALLENRERKETKATAEGGAQKLMATIQLRLSVFWAPKPGLDTSILQYSGGNIQSLSKRALLLR
jgi:hypothetical protein